jgi:hypothetical protein
MNAETPNHADNPSFQRLEAVFALQQPDRTPVLGGWIACPDHVMQIVGVDADTYWADPENISIEAYRRLGADGLVSNFVPSTRDDFRHVNTDSYMNADKGITLEEALAQIDAMPAPEQIENDFDLDAQYQYQLETLLSYQKRCGEMIWMPAEWGAGAAASWYGAFGYENYFLIVALYPDHARKLMEVGGATGNCHARVIARQISEGLRPHAVLLGEDICTQRGPMISPDFLGKYYAPELRHSLEPLLEVGCRPVWHCDGDVRLLLDMLIDAGVKGLQGFQPECGLDIDKAAKMRTRDGEPLIVFGPLSVTTELNVCTPEEIREKTRHAIRICRETGTGLCLFTANTINPDVPLENLLAMHEAAREAD